MRATIKPYNTAGGHVNTSTRMERNGSAIRGRVANPLLSDPRWHDTFDLGGGGEASGVRGGGRFTPPCSQREGGGRGV